MKTLFKWLVRGIAMLALLVLVAGGALAIYVARTWNRTYDAPLPQVSISKDPTVIARGEYLVYGPAHCVECHVATSQDYLTVVDGKKPQLRGGFKFQMGPLGAVYSANLTPDTQTGIGRYSDSQLARMMRYAVRPDGRATIEPMMPFGNLSEADLVAIISYLRAQQPVPNAVPQNEWTVFGKVVKSLSSTFKPRQDVHPAASAPREAPTRERGEYLARDVANCAGCHTPRDEMTFAATGPEFSGGMTMEPAALPGADPATWFISPNLTPAKGSALNKFPDRLTFIARFHNGGRQHAGSPMPWEAFRAMSADDVGALYEFLSSLPPSPGPTGEPTIKKAAN
jgi:mono/diheme cytochrome c family protein